MDVLNKKERNKAFWKFFGLFIVTVGFATFATYFNMKVPQKENKVLNQRFKEQDLLASKELRFATLLDSIKNNLDTLQTSSGNPELMDQTVNAQIIELKRRKPQGLSATQSEMHDNVIEMSIDLASSLKQLREVSLGEKSSAECQEEIRAMELQLIELRSELKIAQQLGNIN